MISRIGNSGIVSMNSIKRESNESSAAAIVPGECADDHADSLGDQHHEDGNGERNAPGIQHAGEQVAAQVVNPQECVRPSALTTPGGAGRADAETSMVSRGKE